MRLFVIADSASLHGLCFHRDSLYVRGMFSLSRTRRFLVDVVVMSVRMRLELRCVCPQCKLVMFMERHGCMIRL